MMYCLRSVCLFAMLVPLGVAGCSQGSGTVPVNGVLLFEDGKPVSGASIRFMPVASTGREATGYTGKEGEFSLSSYRQGDGALPGDYAVVVSKGNPASQGDPAAGANPSPEEMAKAMKTAFEKSQAAPKKVVDPVPSVYGDVKSTPLKWRVEGGNQKVELKLKRT